MCGIAGTFGFNGRDVEEEISQSLINSIKHRGPDHEGVFRRHGILFCHTRLAIITDKINNDQPMCSRDERIVVAYNGEIYNYREVRKELEDIGCQFRTNGDTEVIIHAYIKWGVDAVKRFKGMFAIALYDRDIRGLYLIRDRFGEKPIFFRRHGDQIFFGSEVKAVVINDVITHIDVDKIGLHQYLQTGYSETPRTLLQNISEVPPATIMFFKSDGGVQSTKYWDIDIEKKIKGTYRECAEEYYRLLQQSIRGQLISDQPLGAFLSAGMDSSSINYILSKELNQTVPSFTLKFDNDRYDESALVREMASSLAGENVVEKMPEVTHSLVEDVLFHADSPICDASMLPMYVISKAAAKRVKVCLSGDGADESLAGYNTYLAHKFSRIYSLIPQPLRKNGVEKCIALLKNEDKPYPTRDTAERFIHSANTDIKYRHDTWRTLFKDDEIYELLDFREPTDRYTERQLMARRIHDKNGSILSRLLYSDITRYMQSDMLVKVDRMSMAHGLEVRCPFLDHELVQYAFSMPDEYKLRGLKTKAILKQIMRGKLPDQILKQPKRGFVAPISNWLEGGLREPVNDILQSDIVLFSNLINKNAVRKYLKQFYEKQDKSVNYKIWALYCLAIWCNQVSGMGR